MFFLGYRYAASTQSISATLKWSDDESDGEYTILLKMF